MQTMPDMLRTGKRVSLYAALDMQSYTGRFIVSNGMCVVSMSVGRVFCAKHVRLLQAVCRTRTYLRHKRQRSLSQVFQ